MFSLILTALLIQGGTATEGEAVRSAETAAVSKAAATEDLERKVCRTFRVTGSRAKRERVCMTRAQWIAHERETRDEAGRVTNTGVCSNAEMCSGG
ncbi:hypothetical protein [Pelagerythrobacter marensis]|uniref:Uncharacterized protein n=1 Tax=Pelagerythrobacter marensis TaxID=543877 RepID=A0A0G3X5I9_9SPHN|nr:hypothetical protein [Pelagerythrobacter marensis]AKM06462.1 hypothetical protein AM2010_374 [Pelagerythrobacter marensis]